MPDSQAFWDYLMSYSKGWGMAVYEQDWLHNEWEGLNCTLSSATLSTQWLKQVKNLLYKDPCYEFRKKFLLFTCFAQADGCRRREIRHPNPVHKKLPAVNSLSNPCC